MAKVLPGRYAGAAPDGVVVFLIGMRINKPLKVRKWLPVFIAMPRMLRQLDRNPSAGLLGWHLIFLHGGPAVLQYWRSFEELDRFARDPDALHLPAWKQFNKLVRASGEVGIWHETYNVPPGASEAIYGNMPRAGLAAVADHHPVGSTSATAPIRMGVTDSDEAPVAGY
jgi:hypothetical protein